MRQIRHNYISVGNEFRRSFGGNQMESSSQNMREVGCGVISALDLLLYLCRFHPGCRCDFFADAVEDGVIEPHEYDELALRLSRRFFPLIPKFGINGIMLAGGLNHFFRRYDLPFRATWGLGSGRIFEEIEKMLTEDIPVILSIGPNFPLFWQKHALDLYSAGKDGAPIRACSVKSHYVTVTGIDAKRLYISSWGRPFSIDRDEYLEYIRRRSGSIVSNIVRIRRR